MSFKFNRTTFFIFFFLLLRYPDGEILAAIAEANKFFSCQDVINVRAPSSGQRLDKPVPSSCYSSKVLRQMGYDIERFALESIFNALDGPNWKRRDNWLSGKPLNEWLGVKCKDVYTSSRVVKINLRSNGLSGTIPKSICFLELLDSLDLSFNDIKGSAGEFLAYNPGLKDVWLGNNTLMDEISDASGQLKVKVVKRFPSILIRFDA